MKSKSTLAKLIAGATILYISLSTHAMLITLGGSTILDNGLGDSNCP